MTPTLTGLRVKDSRPVVPTDNPETHYDSPGAMSTRKDDARLAEISLPVRPEDRARVDEKYSFHHGFSDLDRAFGTDWNNNEN